MSNQKYSQTDNLVSKSDAEKIDSKNNTSRHLDLREILEMEKEVNLILKIKKELLEKEKKLENLNNKNRVEFYE
jgi:hypothetical protein